MGETRFSLIVSLIALWVFTIISERELLNMYTSRIDHAIKMRRNIELAKLTYIRDKLIGVANEFFSDIVKIDRSGSSVDLTHYQKYLMTRYASIVEQIELLESITSELSGVPQPLRRFILENWIIPALHIVPNLIIIISSII